TGAGSGITVGHSDLVQITGNQIGERSIGIAVLSSVSPIITGNVVISPTAIGIWVADDLGATVNGNEIDNNNGVGIHYASGEDAVLRANEVTSLFGSVGILLGVSNIPPCNVGVDNILLEANILNGGAPPLQVYCDVGTYTLIP